MNIQKTSFYNDNIDYINNVTFKIILFSNIVSILLFILTTVGIFQINSTYRFILLGYSFISSIIGFLLKKFNTKYKSLTTLFFLTVLEGFITLAGTNAHIGVYMTFCVIPVVVSLYYNNKLTCTINIISYILMLIALYFKYLNGGEIFKNSLGFKEISKTYVPVALGFTIEYIVIFLISYLLTKRNNYLITNMYQALEKIRNSHKKIEEKNKQLEDTQVKIIAFIAECLGSHDLFTGRHVIHTKEFVNMLCKKLVEKGCFLEELTEENIQLFSNAAFLHDIGKIHIPEGILNKIGKFTDEEFERMKSHPAEGRKLLEYLPLIGDGRFNDIAIEMAYCHHEKWNGTGYPRKLAGNDIPLCARIMAAADVLDALISQRLYKDPMSVDQAMKVFEESKGSHFEPCIADAVIECRELIEEIDKKFKEEEASVYNEELQWWNSYHQKK